jgi:hypothetical protein
MDVPIEVHGAPDHDHPDREHEADGKGCVHRIVLPGGRILQKSGVSLCQAARAANRPPILIADFKQVTPSSIDQGGGKRRGEGMGR